VKIPRSGLAALVASMLTAVSLTGAGPTSLFNGAQQAPQGALATGLTQQLDALLTNRAFTGSQVELVVRDAATGDLLYDRNGGNRLLPASNMKLFTSTAAMDLLGPSFRFHTDALTSAPVLAGKLRGDLYLKGYGDPTTLASDYAELAKQVAASGVQRIDGDIVADDSYFDAVRLGDIWSWDDEPFYYNAQISALTVAPNTDYDSGTVIVQFGPGSAPGQPAKLSLIPDNDLIKFRGTVTTGAPGSDNTFSIEREHGTNVVDVSGSIPADDEPALEWVTVWEPTNYAADVFLRALRDAGVEVRGHIARGTTPAGSRLIGRDTSMPLGEMLTPFLKLSNNMHAEALVKTLGAEKAGGGTWGAGLGVVTDWARTAGVDTSTVRFSDGSGLSRKDNVTGDAITDVLIAARTKPWFQQWYDALPIAGNPDRFVGGTLRSRMAGTPAANNLHGKTGSLTGVTALSGYVTDADGRALVFSMVSNNYLISPRSVEDAVGVTLASYSENNAAAAATVRPAPAPKAGTAEQLEWCVVKSC
jgi:serine-type D-Ala-D-Ala carboxypeptidase/endopeptidase (penicillin-binding protein 4)